MMYIGVNNLCNNSNELPTPCYIFDEAEFGRGIDGFKEALLTRFADVAIGYSVKTNSLPYALRQARLHGCMAEVVSHDEYQLARLCGFEPREIIYNGPMKSRETFVEAIQGGAIVNLETKRELEWLAAMPAGRTYNVGIRLNINISHVSPKDADSADDNSRFGFSDESSEFADVLGALRAMPGVRVAGLHIHRTTHWREPRFYERSVDYAARVIEKYGLELDYLDVGGGYFGIFPNKPTFADYAAAFHKGLSRHGMERLRIIVEPGNALTASAFSFLSEVIDVKQVDEHTRFVTTDGSRNDIDPFFRKSDYLKEILYRDSSRPAEPRQLVAGCTCLEYDRMFTLSDSPRLEVGDRILYNNVGAYTLTLTPQFIRLWPGVYAVDNDGNSRQVRRPSTAADIILFDK